MPVIMLGISNLAIQSFFEGLVIPEEPGELTGAIVFTYEDSTGEMIEERQEFTLNVVEMVMDEFPEDIPPMDEPKGIKKLLKSKVFLDYFSLNSSRRWWICILQKEKKEKGMALDE